MNIKLNQNELYAMEFVSGWHRYHTFGKSPRIMLKHLVKMYNWNASSNYNSATFRKLCNSEPDYRVFLYKFNVNEPFGFDDDCQSIGTRGGTKLGDYFKLLDAWPKLKGE